MAVTNVHERLLPKHPGALIDELGSPADRLWPAQAWPPLGLDRPLSVGAAGGHGPIRYFVESYVPSEWVRFCFSGPPGAHGFHEFICQDGPEGAVLRHTLVISPRGPARLSWPLAFRWLHDALLEDLLDRAELITTGTVARPARWSPLVRTLRGLSRPRRSDGQRLARPDGIGDQR